MNCEHETKLLFCKNLHKLPKPQNENPWEHDFFEDIEMIVIGNNVGGIGGKGAINKFVVIMIGFNQMEIEIRAVRGVSLLSFRCSICLHPKACPFPRRLSEHSIHTPHH